ncbi:hypothetical protein H671_8g19697 [Cricetulus griseus]|uniref:Uncharacterized protein n=1 Tax=Cricetulus griseus TaxID=10029 RepID=A0A061HVG8_CRIGR|nr:hypothetical protein H671_8g19697 [Cricetulus griseus]
MNILTLTPSSINKTGPFTSISGTYRIFVHMVDHIDGFSYVEPSLHHWDEAYLIMVADFSDMFLDSVRQYFI